MNAKETAASFPGTSKGVQAVSKPQREWPGPPGDMSGHRVAAFGPLPLPGHALAGCHMHRAIPGPWTAGTLEKQGLRPSHRLSACPPSRPWHSNQRPLTSHLAISVNQLKLARCHKNIYFHAIGKFKSSSWAMLPRQLCPTLDSTAQEGATGHTG